MSQATRIIAHLARGGTLTRLDAWDKLGVVEAPARISELRRAGWQISTETVEVENRYGERVKVARWRYVDCPGNERRLLELKRADFQRRYDAMEFGSPSRAYLERRLTVIEASLQQLARMTEGAA